jgi:hypothetical protein
MILSELKAVLPIYLVITACVNYENDRGKDVRGTLKLVFVCNDHAETLDFEERFKQCQAEDAELDESSNFIQTSCRNGFDNISQVLDVSVGDVKVGGSPARGKRTFTGTGRMADEVLPEHLRRPPLAEEDFPIIYDIIKKKLEAKQEIVVLGNVLLGIKWSERMREFCLTARTGSSSASCFYLPLARLSRYRLIRTDTGWEAIES